MQKLIYRLKENDISLSYEKLHCRILAFVHESTKGNPHIILNEFLLFLPDKREKIILHELKHIRDDFDKNYIVGLDMQHHNLEKEADSIASSFLDQLNGKES